VGPIAVVPLAKIDEEAIELADRGDQPRQVGDRALERPEHSLDATVRPGVAGLGANVSHAVTSEARLDLDRAEGRGR